MKINYVYNEQGIAEYVIIPTNLWVEVQEFLRKKNLITTEDLKSNETENNFNPQEYFGIISHLNLNIELELKSIREEWKRDF